MKKGLTIGLIIASLGGLIYAGYRYAKNQVKLLEASCYKFKDFKFNKLSKDNISITVNLLVKNISKIAFTLLNYKLDVYINDFKVATISKTLNQEIKADGGISTVGLDINFNPKNAIPDLSKVIEIISAATFNRDKFKLRFKGYINIKQSVIERKQDLDMTFTLAEILQPSSQATTTCEI